MPDPRIEQRLLSALRAVTRGSPRKIVLTSRKKSPSDEPKQGPSAGDDSNQQGDSQSMSQLLNGDDEEGRSSKDSTPPITTNDLLNRAETAATSAEFLVSPDDKKEDDTNGKYLLPLTIRANPPVPQKTPSPEPTSSQEPIIGSEQIVPKSASQQPEVPQTDSAEVPLVGLQQPIPKPNIIPTVPTAVRSPALKPSILSRSPMKPTAGQEGQSSLTNSTATPAFQPQPETTIVDTIEQTRAPSSSESSQQTNLSVEKSHSNDGFSFPVDQKQVVVTDDRP